VVRLVTRAEPAICRLTGELDTFTESEMRRDLSEVVGAERLVIELADVLCFDAVGLAILMEALRQTRSLGGKVAIVCNAPSLLRVLSEGDFERLATVSDTVETAVARLGAGSQSLEKSRDFGYLARQEHDRGA
jgi:anti-anti-sigma factor